MQYIERHSRRSFNFASFGCRNDGNHTQVTVNLQLFRTFSSTCLKRFSKSAFMASIDVFMPALRGGVSQWQSGCKGNLNSFRNKYSILFQQIFSTLTYPDGVGLAAHG
ncbi:hypothetical protein ACIPF8_03050 [Collimonas sp. NPDC087041]|uniref:hypothetical protein n=1 Tax=Collimonas sp. NPDC087041 TaxID=3363960 RepID=UPI003822D41D